MEVHPVPSWNGGDWTKKNKFMPTGNSLVGADEGFCDVSSDAQVLDRLEAWFRSRGATHFLATGVALPGRPVEPLILRMNWGELRGDRLHAGQINPREPLLHLTLGASGASLRHGPAEGLAQPGGSPLLAMVGEARSVFVIAAAVNAFLPYQACVIAAGQGLALDPKLLVAIDALCTAAFRRLFALGTLRADRPGELSARERKVVELSAVGKTASEIAGVLEISQRTVHAHLQNASEKLRAHNKTHTVVEALRYGQITA